MYTNKYINLSIYLSIYLDQSQSLPPPPLTRSRSLRDRLLISLRASSKRKRPRALERARPAFCEIGAVDFLPADGANGRRGPPPRISSAARAPLRPYAPLVCALPRPSNSNVRRGRDALARRALMPPRCPRRNRSRRLRAGTRNGNSSARIGPGLSIFPIWTDGQFNPATGLSWG